MPLWQKWFCAIKGNFLLWQNSCFFITFPKRPFGREIIHPWDCSKQMVSFGVFPIPSGTEFHTVLIVICCKVSAFNFAIIYIRRTLRFTTVTIKHQIEYIKKIFHNQTYLLFVDLLWFSKHICSCTRCMLFIAGCHITGGNIVPRLSFLVFLQSPIRCTFRTARRIPLGSEKSKLSIRHWRSWPAVSRKLESMEAYSRFARIKNSPGIPTSYLNK